MIALLAICLCVLVGTVFCWKDRSPAAYHAVIETIATSNGVDDVHTAYDLLQSGGLPAIEVLLTYLQDTRVPPHNYLMRAVIGTPDMSDYCFWLIQDILEDPRPKMESVYSPLNKTNIQQWLSTRSGKTLSELRVDACAEAIENIRSLQQSETNISADESELDAAAYQANLLVALTAAYLNEYDPATSDRLSKSSSKPPAPSSAPGASSSIVSVIVRVIIA